MDKDFSSLKEDIENFKSISKEEIGAHLVEVKETIAGSIKCKYYLMSCTANEIREDDFIRLLNKKAIKYVLQYCEVNKIDANNAMELTAKARDRFRSEKTSGEVGELILFLLLESQSIIQILKKMDLKTSGEVNYFGLDAIHLEIRNDNEAVIHYGESKMIAGFSTAIKKAYVSLDDFHKQISNEDLEVNLILSNLDQSKFEKYLDIISDIFDPYVEDKSNISKVNSVFIGYNETFLRKYKKTDGVLMDYCKGELHSKIEGSNIKIRHKLEEFPNIKNKEYIFHIIPFVNVTNFNLRFLKLLKGYHE